MYLSAFKSRGLLHYKRLLSIPSPDRLPALTRTEQGRYTVLVGLCAALKSCFDNMNLKYCPNEDQVIEIADAIIDESSEDNLSLEDVMLFLQQLSTGKAGKIYDRMDVPLFFELFEGYRETRHQALRTIQYEKHVQYKSLGDPSRTSEKVDKGDEAYRQALNEYYKKQYAAQEKGL